MPRNRVVYDPKLKETLEWQSLYNRYKHTPKYREIFDSFNEFYDWSMSHGFEIGAQLMRWDDRKPWQPDNCYWKATKEKNVPLYGDEQRERIAKWNKTVNRIRIHYGMTPL